MNYPKISIITPSYNQGQFLEKTILSVINQNYPNTEYIIIDGGSNDNSVNIIQKYHKKITYWQSKADRGQSYAINEGFKHATGDIYCWLNSDDQLADNALYIVAEYFIKNSKCRWLTGIGKLITIQNKEYKTLIPPEKISFKNLIDWKNNEIFQPSTFWKADLWDKVGGVNENLHYAMDFDLWLKFSKVTECHPIKKLLSFALYHKNMKTFRDSHLSFVELCLTLGIHGELALARNMLGRVVEKTYYLDRKFRFITRNKLYRKWREKREKQKYK